MKPPFFVIGSPRSGTTFLAEALNRHEMILITNELRVMTYVNRALNRLPKNKWILMNGRTSFLDHLKHEIPGVLERYYEGLGASEETRWGDKHPHYADPATDAECLDLINELFPGSQFLNLVRDGREVVTSLMSKGWADLAEAIDVWRRHVMHADNFGSKLPPQRFLTIRYEQLVERPFDTMNVVFDFLGVGPSAVVDGFLRDQDHERTPFSKPTTSQIGRTVADSRLTEGQRRMVHDELGPLLSQLGYVD
jgi:hypothetical protein